MAKKQALVVVDIQNDFCPGGALAVREGDEVVPVINAYIQRFQEAGLHVVASRDWHPEQTRHFIAGGGVWPPHGIQGTPGAAFHAGLRLPPDAVIITKGADPAEDAYSVFQGKDSNGRDLASLLHEWGITDLAVGGLATDYCVRSTALDAVPLGFTTSPCWKMPSDGSTSSPATATAPWRTWTPPVSDARVSLMPNGSSPFDS